MFENLFNDGDYVVIHCPYCNGNYVHAGAISTVLCGDESGGGPRNDNEYTEEPSIWRRPGIAIEMNGECGHRWRLRIQQHKGQEFVFQETLQPVQVPLMVTEKRQSEIDPVALAILRDGKL